MKDFDEAKAILAQLPVLKDIVQKRLIEIQDDADFLKQFKAFQKQKIAEEAQRTRQELNNLRWSMVVHSSIRSSL